MRSVGAAGLVALAALGAAHPARAASLVLDEGERREAIELGQRSVTQDTFGAEWRVTGGQGEAVTVITPFHRLAIAARHAAFEERSLSPADEARALKESRDRLAFWVELRGDRPDFARFLRPRLHAGDREIEPSLVQNERTAAPLGDGRFLARCTYWFPSKELTPTSRVDLVVRDADNRPVARFAIDLGRMR